MNTTAGVAGSTVSGIMPAREIPVVYSARESLSRHGSVASSRRSEASSPSVSSSLYQTDHFPGTIPLRTPSMSHHPQPTAQHQHAPSNTPFHPTIVPGSARTSFTPSAIAIARVEEAAQHRSELEVAKRENEFLRRKIRDLERSLNTQGRVGSRVETGGASEDDGDGDAVRVGESAGSAGIVVPR